MTDSRNLAKLPIGSAEQQRQLRRLAHEIENGLPVYDLNGERVGDVKEYNTVASSLQVSAGVFGQKELYLPMRLIADITAREIHLVAPKDALAVEYGQPPAIATSVENRVERRDTTSQPLRAREVQLIPSGYNGDMVELSAVELSDIAERLSVGLTVYDQDGVRLGEIAEFDANRWIIVDESGVFSPVYRVAPFSAIGSINRDTQSAHLSVQEAALHRAHGSLPGDR